MSLAGLSVLVTGGTGSFGRAFVRFALDNGAGRVIVLSRDELKQHDLRGLPGFGGDRVRWFLGDVRDVSRLRRAFRGVDVVVHAAALKQVLACEYNPLEAVRTNVDGAANVIDAALDCGVGRVLALGTDKGCDPTNLYGASKLVAEKLFVDANAYSGAGGPRFACTRYGNVLGSRGSVLPLLQGQHGRGEQLTLTDPDATRFVLTLDQGVRFVAGCLERMEGGEVFVPSLPAVDLLTVAAAVTWPEPPELEVSGLRPGEKRHELLVSENERRVLGVFGDEFPHWVVGRGGPGPAVSSASVERLDVDGFRQLAGIGDVLDSQDNAKERPRAATAPGA